jgi:phenylalanyl-tRNA synthetase beta chain
MLVCWEWLEQYVDLSIGHDKMAAMFAMSGLNHEWTRQVGRDIVMDLEVTSNRGDCLSHIGIAREAAVLLGNRLRLPDPAPKFGALSAKSLLQIDNQFLDACSRYTARVIRGVKVGPSPEWLVRRLNAVGINTVNNVVDVTNYVMMECGQPLHAFDLAKIGGARIIIRPAREKEMFTAIDHRNYELDSRMLVIADANQPIALGGVMGGAESEVSDTTTDLLIEAAGFAPMSVRRTVRKLKLESPSSFRFERRPDPAILDWASLRCCQLIQQIAGGEVCQGSVDTGDNCIPREPISFRLEQIERVLGIAVQQDAVINILTNLGCAVVHAESTSNRMVVTPPSWRCDLTREIDLIEEVARIHGYEQIPEDVVVPIAIAASRPRDVVLERVRHVLSAYGIDEAMTPSVVTDTLEACGSVWTEALPLATETPLLVGSRLLRRSLLPSLLAARYHNQTLAERNAQLYEIANIFLPEPEATGLPREQSSLGIVAGGELRNIRGIVESILEKVLPPQMNVVWKPAQHAFYRSGTALFLSIDEHVLGWLGIVCPKVQAALSLDQPCTAAELDLGCLTTYLQAVRTAGPVSPFPAVARDLNFVLDEGRTWEQLSKVCQSAGGELLQHVDYRETYRDPAKDGAGRKRILISLHFQSLNRTLTSEEVDESVKRIVESCQSDLAATLLG